METVDPVAAVRRFNRFYTRAIGVLDKTYLGSPYTVTEGRVLYEIANGVGLTPKAIGEIIGLDAGYLSRIVARLERDGMVARERSPNDGRSVTLRLTEAGAEMFAAFNQRSANLVEGLIAKLSAPERARLVGAMETAQALLEPERTPPPVLLRLHTPGDMGWVVERHGEIYSREYGWGPKLVSITARICADFLDRFDPEKERCWIAERDGVRLGSVFLVNEGEGVARLRLLLLDPAARGAGVGSRLVESCVAFAREAGYREIILWTHQKLTAARAIYAATGFKLVESHLHDDFGIEEVSETWRLVF